MNEAPSQIGAKRRQRKADRRVARTLRNIRRAFYELLAEKELEKITVSEITQRADIDRKTFYLHYASIEELVEEESRAVADRLTRTLVTEDPADGDPFKLRRLFAELIAISDAAPQAYRRALKTMSTDQLAKQLSMPVCGAAFEAFGIEAEDDRRACRYLVLFCLSGTLSAFSLYLEEDDTPTAEEILAIVDDATALMKGKLAGRRKAAEGLS